MNTSKTLSKQGSSHIKTVFLAGSILFVIILLGFFMTTSRTATSEDPDGFNRLIDSSSPYLLKHAENPVDWYEWGDEALEKAKREDKLIFLSIGYTACHWCNELESECFEHQDFADVINPRYVAIKVDREQRPDLDDIYMQAAISFRGSGGWPNNVFLTPDLNPVYAIGYQKREVFKNILLSVDKQWKEDREKIRESGEMITRELKAHLERGGEFENTAKLSMSAITNYMDKKDGGFGSSTKFPMTSALEFILTEALDDTFLITTLDNMAGRGMYDHVGGGFHRYSVDKEWAVPHFEKMLYDNALLARLYARAALILNKPEYGEVARQTLKFIERELMNDEGGFVSSLDADSEGGEGAYYIWSLDDIKAADVDPRFAEDYGVSEEGNVFDIVVTENGAEQHPTGKSALSRKNEHSHKESLSKLYEARKSRSRPPLDDKVVASWHALTISAFAIAGVALDDPNLITRAEKGARFTLEKLKFSHNWRNGMASGAANLEDHAFAAMAFWNLFEATGRDEYFAEAIKYVNRAKLLFSAGDGGYYTVEPSPDLIARPRAGDDNPLPSGAAVLARVDWRLSAALDDSSRKKDSIKTAQHLIGVMGGANLQGGEAMILHQETSNERVEVVYAFAEDEKKKLEWLRKGFTRRWGVVKIPLGASSISPILSEGRLPVTETRAYVCRDTICLIPSATPDEVTTRIESLDGA